MLLFQSPPSTRYDLRFSLFGIPISVHPLFWLLVLLLGSSGGLTEILIWILVVFVSVIVHELGHALAFRRYGLGSRIVLYMGGGLTIPEAVAWGGSYANVAPSAMQGIVISLAGPFAGFLLAGLVIAGVNLLGGSIAFGFLLGFIPIPQLRSLPIESDIVIQFIRLMLWVNVFWGLLNLVPVFPLDGGQVARNVLIQYDPFDGARKSLWLSVIAGGVMAIAGWLFFGSPYMALLFGLMAFQSYQSLNVRY